MKRTILALLVLVAAGAFAQDEKDEKPKIWVHAPAEDLLALFPGKEEGFLISLKEYERLLAAAEAREATLREQSPLPARLVKGTATATVKDDLLAMEASYVAVVSQDGPAEVAFPLQGIALESIAIDGGELAGESLRFSRRGTYSFTVNLSARMRKSGELFRAQFRLPPAAGQKVTLTLPAGVEGEVGPIVRAFKTGPKGGRVVGYPDETGLFTLWYRPRAPARDLAPLLAADFNVRAQVGEAGTVAKTDLAIAILRAPVDHVAILFPKGLTIRGLSGKRVKSWRLVRGEAGGDRLVVRLTEPVEGMVVLNVESEATREKADRAPIPIPRLPGAARYSGAVSVQAQRPVRITGLEAEGMRRLDSSPKRGVALFRVWSQRARLTA